MENSIPTKRKVEIAQALMKRAIEISDHTEHDVFVYYSPHVNELDVSVHKYGWKEGERSTTSIYLSFDADADTESDLVAIKSMLDSLEEENA